nr:putative late blight resistance protein homolog R1B-17 isoform X4 [Ipomoea trifida]
MFEQICLPWNNKIHSHTILKILSSNKLSKEELKKKKKYSAAIIISSSAAICFVEGLNYSHVEISLATWLWLHEIFTQAVKQTDYLKKKLIKIKTEKQLAKGSSQVYKKKISCRWIGRASGFNLHPSAECFHKSHSIHHPYVYYLGSVERLYSRFKLLRVVDIENIPSGQHGVIYALANLIHLRYLALRSIMYSYSPTYFHLELFEHWNMQSFIVHGALDSFDAYGIWKMPLLRNFCIQRIDSLGSLSVVHTNLESISWLNSKLCTKDLFTMIPNLKKLGVCDRYDEKNQDCFYSFEHLGQLEELSIRGWYFNHIPCSDISWSTSFLPNLKKLKFFLTSLAWSDMRLIGLLPNLEVLKLKHAIVREDKIWETSEEGFLKLKRLVIEYEWLEHWSAESDHFPLLECLEICECKYLREIPSGFADITTLALIQLNRCSDSVLDSAKSIQEEQNSNYGNAFHVRSEMGVDKYRFVSSLKL